MVNVSKQAEAEYQYDWQNPNLKSFDFGRMMGRTFRGAKHCGKTFWLPVLFLFGIPGFLIALWPIFLPDGAYSELLTNGDFEAFGGFLTPITGTISVLIYFAFIVISSILYVALSHNVFGFYNDNAPSSRESFQRGTSRVWGTIGAMIIFMFGITIGLFLLIIPGILLMLGWYLISPILAMEDKGPMETLSRSWELSKGSKRWILLFFIVLTIISLVLTTVFSLISLPFGNQALALLEGGSTTFWIMNAISSALTQVFVLFITVAGLTSIYYEIREMKEGVNQDKLSAVFD